MVRCVRRPASQDSRRSGQFRCPPLCLELSVDPKDLLSFSLFPSLRLGRWAGPKIRCRRCCCLRRSFVGECLRPPHPPFSSSKVFAFSFSLFVFTLLSRLVGLSLPASLPKRSLLSRFISSNPIENRLIRLCSVNRGRIASKVTRECWL